MGALSPGSGRPVNSQKLALEFVHAGQEGGSPQALVAGYSTVLQKFGVSYYCIGEICRNSRTRGRIWSASAHRWFEHWTAREYVRADPVVNYLRRHQSFVRWSQIRDCGDRPGSEIFERAAEFGLRDGLAFFLSLGRDRVAALGLAMEVVPDDEAMNLALHLATVYFATRMAQLRDIPPPATRPLTERERECLRWVAAGRRDSEIGDILRISELTARQHVTSAVRKLKARTRPQAVAIAVSTNQIRL